MSATPRKVPLVLVVEDDSSTNLMIRSIMTQLGFQAVGVHAIAEALAAIQQQPPDLVLLDVSLPDGSGFDLCRRLQGSGRDFQTPVLFISSHEDTSTKVRGFEAGAVDYITKPIARAELAARVSTHLRLRQAFETLTELQAERIQRLTNVQDSLMPKPEDLPEARFQVSIEQVGKAGGDFYDVIPAAGGVVDYLVADVSGHDLDSSYWTSALKTLIAQYATPANSPREVLQSMNRVLCRVLPEGVFFTAVYARLNRKTRRLSLVNAGHPPAVLIRRGSSSVQLLEMEGDVMGIFPDAVFGVGEFEVGASDRLFLYSDGLIEMTGDRDDGIRRLTEACLASRSYELPETIRRVRIGAVGGAKAQDDIVLLGVEV